jgi:hypothetical protein
VTSPLTHNLGGATAATPPARCGYLLLQQAVRRGLLEAVVRSGAGSRPAAVGAAGRWLVRWAPDHVSPPGLEPLCVHRPLRVQPTTCALRYGASNRCLRAGPTGGFAETRSQRWTTVVGRGRTLPLPVDSTESSRFAVAGSKADGDLRPDSATNGRPRPAALGRSVPSACVANGRAVHSPSPQGRGQPYLHGCNGWLNEGAGPRRRCGCPRMPPRRAPKRRAASCPRCRRRAWRLEL